MNDNLQQELFDAFEANDLEAVKRCIEQGADVNATDINGRSTLHDAAHWNLDVEIMKYLASQGANVNAKDINGYTPLHCVSRRSGIASQYDDEVNRYEQKRACAGMIDLWSRECELRKQYWDRARDILEERYTDGSTVILAFLIDKGADVNAKNVCGRTPLHYAVESNPFLSDIQYLIRRGANVNAVDDEGKTPLDIAKHPKIRKILLAAEVKSGDNAETE